MDTGMDRGSGGPSGMSNGQDLSKRQGLIAVNDLTYVLEPDLSVASNKTHKVHFFQANEYVSNQSAICILNSGADYIDTRRSWLQFDIEAEGTDQLYNFGVNGSACNLIKQITVSTRSGDVLCQLFDYNLLQHMILPLTHDKGWFDTVGQTMAYGGGIKSGTKTRLLIPMYVLSPLFAYGRLMPAMLMSGLRIEIQWENPDIVAEAKSTAPPNADGTVVAAVAMPAYKITDPQFVLCSVQLSDSIQRALNELSATNGLEIVYTDYERNPARYNNMMPEVHLEIRKSCSRALKAFARFRPTNFTSEFKQDSFRAETSPKVYEYQWQLGSLYFPQQPVRGSNNNGGIDRVTVSSYAHLLEACDKFHSTTHPLYVSLYGTKADPAEYKDLTPVEMKTSGAFGGSSHTIGVTLERSTMFNLAGVPVNNSRVLALHARLSNDTREDAANFANGTIQRQLDVFLKYVKLARVFLNNVEVEQ